MVMVAGVLHLVSLPGHLQEARGAGLFFLVAGTAQVVWGCVFLLRPTPGKAKLGVVALTVAPSVLWLMTRSLRSPWGTGPETVDVMSAATVALQASAAAVLLLARLGTPDAAPARRMGIAALVVVVAGAALGAGTYGGAIAAEASLPWLGEPDAPHMHGEPEAPHMHGEPEAPHADAGHPHATATPGHPVAD